MRALLLGLSLLGGPNFEHVILISVDGLRSDALLAESPEALPAFARMLAGASTLNARTDPDFTLTLPNHTCMLTGRPVLGELGHAWVGNGDPPPGSSLGKNKGTYVATIFDVAHDRGVETAVFAGKAKFHLYPGSLDGENGAPDIVDEDQGRKKIDDYAYLEESAEIADGVLRNLKSGGPRSLVFAHFAAADLAAHEHGWDLTSGSRYLKALRAVDREIGRILDRAQADDSLRGRTAVVLTSDHGGGAPFKSHDRARMWVNYIIPFLVWTGDGGERRDLYELNPLTRRDPSLSQPRGASSAPPPIRNGDAGNLCLGLLGLPPIPGSTINAGQDLAVFPAR